MAQGRGQQVSPAHQKPPVHLGTGTGASLPALRAGPASVFAACSHTLTRRGSWRPSFRLISGHRRDLHWRLGDSGSTNAKLVTLLAQRPDRVPRPSTARQPLQPRLTYSSSRCQCRYTCRKIQSTRNGNRCRKTITSRKRMMLPLGRTRCVAAPAVPVLMNAPSFWNNARRLTCTTPVPRRAVELHDVAHALEEVRHERSGHRCSRFPPARTRRPRCFQIVREAPSKGTRRICRPRRFRFGVRSGQNPTAGRPAGQSQSRSSRCTVSI